MELHFNNGDAISAALLGGLGGYILLESRQWSYIGPDGPGPAFFPTWYGIGLIVLSLMVIAARLYRLRTGDNHAKRIAAGEKREIFHALAVWLAFAVSIALLKVLGFIIAFGLFTLFIVALIYRRPWPSAITIAVASASGFYVVFPLALGVDLPRGVFGL